MKSWETCLGCETIVKSLAGLQKGLGRRPQKESNALGMFPNALRFP